MNKDKKKEEEIKKLEKQLNNINIEQDSIFKIMNERRKILEESNKTTEIKRD